MSSVCAIVVTYNRKQLLRECLYAIAGQSRPPERILVVDNASSDGTPAMLKDDFADVELLALSTNEGGAGGFHEGIKQAHAEGADWMWVMDDDTIPEPDALAELLAAPERLGTASPPALLASRVVWRDGRAHPMNAPWPERTRVERVIDGAERGLLPLRFATFVSLLVHRGTVDRHGLPLKNFFIWSDDVEYTSRVLLGGDLAYLVPTSVPCTRPKGRTSSCRRRPIASTTTCAIRSSSRGSEAEAGGTGSSASSSSSRRCSNICAGTRVPPAPPRSCAACATA